jgi:hypothetical protein
MDDEIAPRLQPKSLLTADKNVPNVNCMTGPLPTIKPKIEATTTNQRLIELISINVLGNRYSY